MLTNIAENDLRLQIITETFEYSDIPMFWCTDSSFAIVNTSFLTLTKYTKEELLQKGFNDVSKKQASQLSLQEMFSTTKRDFKILTWVLETANGDSISLELRITQFFIDTQQYYYGVVRNLSSKQPQTPVFKEDAERLEIALQASEQGLWDWNVIANETFYSKEYYALLGYENEGFAANYGSWVSMLHPDDIDSATTHWESFIANSENDYTDEFRLQKKDESYIWVCSQGRVIDRDKKGVPLRIIGIIKNIDVKKLNELKIHTQTQKLIDYTFFNSHRLRAPLSSILGLTELLKLEYSPEIVESLSTVSHQLDDMVHEINQILVGDSFNYKQLQNTPIKKISLIDNDKVLHIVYKKTIERYTENVEITAYERAKQVLELLDNKTLNTDLILLDIDSAFDIWGFLEAFNKTESVIPIYLLAKNIAITDTVKATNFDCVKGILLKPLDRQAFANFINQVNN